VSGALDTLLAARSGRTPIRVGLVGAGAAGRAIALQLAGSVPGIRLAAIANRTLDHAYQALARAGVPRPTTVDDPVALDREVERGGVAVASDPDVLSASSAIDILVEATGTLEFAARTVTRALEHRKPVVLVNVELDATVGPILARRAGELGLVLTNTDGDEPGVAMTLLRYLRSVGLRPVGAGNLKGLLDPRRTPDTQRAFAERFGQDPRKATSFADGTKLSMEATVLANATGFRVGRLGMYGPRCDHVSEVAALLPAPELLDGGLVDYALGAAPHTGAFVIVHEPHAEKRRLLAYGKMGDGPFYVFYTPFHLPHVQLAATIARAILHGDPTVTPLGAPVCDTVAVAKRDLRAGEVLDGIGGFCAYGQVDNAGAARAADALPMGVAEGCRLVRDIAPDQVLSYRDIELPPDRLIDRLRREQDAMVQAPAPPRGRASLLSRPA